MIHVMVNLIMTNMGEPEAIKAIKEGFVKSITQNIKLFHNHQAVVTDVTLSLLILVQQKH